ncbi:MAG: hypothetical protein KatS3mg009_2052 [Acidimicrobiia bacterium]|nr:MAG: hypothetical protein KatS3mg009_2052 [Acidimicrobiia bacterium]
MRTSDTITSPDGTFRLDPADFAAQTGWELKPQGLCRGDACIPVRDRGDLVVGGRVDVRAFAVLTGRPLALDEEAGLAVLGVASAERAAERAAMVVEDFELPTADGGRFRWSSIGHRKKLLFAWASW